MTTSSVNQKVILTPKKAGLMSFPGITIESATTISELLQENDDEFHGFFDPRGFHNHIVEALLAAYDFGATPDNLRTIYNRIKLLQRPRPQINQRALVDLADESTWHKYIGNHDHYSDFLVFFQKEMAEIGWQQMVNKRLFSGTEAAEDLFVRCYSGIYHPIIRIGYGLEFGLPGLIPEGLALAACSGDWPREFLLRSQEEAAGAKGSAGKSLKALLDEIRSDEKIRGSGLNPKDRMIYLHLLDNVQDEMISYAKQYRVPVDQINESLAETINISAFIAGGSVRKDKEIKFDFFLMHSLTTSIFLTTFMSQDWITPENKARLLEWKSRFDLLSYATTGTPELHIDEIKNYVPKAPQDGAGNPWLDIIERGVRLEDDGHAIKTIRALVNGERISAKYSNVPEGLDLPIVGGMWRKIAEMCIDSVEAKGGGQPMWIRGAGFDEAWESIGARKFYLRSVL